MESISAAPRMQGHAPLPPVEAMEDVLYDILATGVDPTAKVGTLEAVQVLLHEHARARKSQAELAAFFVEHGLPLAGERPRAPVIALPPIEPAAISGIELMPSQRIAEPARSVSAKLTWIGVAFAAAVLLGTGVAGYFALHDMRQELSRVKASSSVQASQLTQVKAEAATLRSAMTENAELMRSVDHKSDVLIQSLLSPLDPAALQNNPK
ncbi:MAG TPA: hypothetical protein VHM19_12830 [Polyangiales bacterium]|jgi:hypothetical protein|nr:hypothetical protein [Polyangiales bacterium]